MSKSPISISLSRTAYAKIERLAKMLDTSKSAVIERLANELPDLTEAIIDRTHLGIIIKMPITLRASQTYIAGMANMDLVKLQKHYMEMATGVVGILQTALAVEQIILEETCGKEST